MRILACGASHRGNVRAHNEDNILVDGKFRQSLDEDKVFIRSDRSEGPYTYGVFDGLGGEAYGEQASLIGALGLCEMDRRDLVKDVEEYISAVNKSIINEAATKETRTIGTTAAVLHIENEKALIFNVGDSRVYLLRNGEIDILSKDHTVVQSMIDCGFLKEEDRTSNSHAGELTQYLGMTTEDGIEPAAYIEEIDVLDGDIFLLCSDGLYGELSTDEIRDYLEKEKNSEVKEITLKLMNLALKKKALDNISVIICKAIEE